MARTPWGTRKSGEGVLYDENLTATAGGTPPDGPGGGTKNSPVRHNTKLLEAALHVVNQRALVPPTVAEAEAQRKRLGAVALRNLATGAAILLAAVGVAILIGQFLTERAPPEIVRPDPSTELPVPPPPPEAEASKVVTNYNIFRSFSLNSAGRRWELTAGHIFSSSRATNWNQAWCYTITEVDGVDVRVELARRSGPASPPTGPTSGKKTVDAVGLSDAEAITLATNCPWLDGKRFKPKQFKPFAEYPNPFDISSPKISLDGRTLNYSGPITANIATLFGKYDFDRLVIDSVGGVLGGAIAGGRWLREHGVNVRVRDHCASACVYLIAGGVVRQADEKAKVCVHQFSSSGASSDPEGDAQIVSAQIIHYLEAMDVKTDLYKSMSVVPKNDIKCIDHDRLKKWNLLNDRQKSLFGGTTIIWLDIPGNDLIPKGLAIPTFETCVRVCQERNDCVAVTYNQKARHCFLKYSVGRYSRSRDARSWEKSESSQGDSIAESEDETNSKSSEYGIQVGAFSSRSGSRNALDRAWSVFQEDGLLIRGEWRKLERYTYPPGTEGGTDYRARILGSQVERALTRHAKHSGQGR